MLNQEPISNLQLLQELAQRLKSQVIGFWIEGQDCYLWENTLHYSNKIKVGELSLTRENYYSKMFKAFDQYYQASEARKKILNSKFSTISDVELVEELKNRESTIKLSLNLGDQFVTVEAEDIKCESGITLPIKIEEENE